MTDLLNILALIIVTPFAVFSTTVLLVTPVMLALKIIRRFTN